MGPFVFPFKSYHNSLRLCFGLNLKKYSHVKIHKQLRTEMYKTNQISNFIEELYEDTKLPEKVRKNTINCTIGMMGKKLVTKYEGSQLFLNEGEANDHYKDIFSSDE